MTHAKNNFIKYIIGLIIVITVRLLPHPPNVEPITATLMPFAGKWGALAGLAFGLLAVLSYDVLTGTLGIWSLLTLAGYGLLGIGAGVYFNKFGTSHMQYVLFAIGGTLFYDALTGLTVGPLVFGQPFMQALVGQVPFTLYHVAGNIVLALVASPLIEAWVVGNEKLESKAVAKLLHV